MADVQPLRALHLDPAVAGDLQARISPPYDVVDDGQRARLAARSPFNAVHVDLPRDPGGGDPYAHAAAVLASWERDGALVQDPEDAFWVLEQRFDRRGRDGIVRRAARRGVLARVRVEEYGPGRIRPHERTHPGPKQDRLDLTRATRANLSPIFSLFDDPDGAVAAALAPHVDGRPPRAAATDDEGTTQRLWRVADPTAVAAVTGALAGRELLIADGHHRYETARAYADEIGGEGPHRFTLMLLTALQDPGLEVLPTHRLLTGLDDARRERLTAVLAARFDVEPLDDARALRPDDGDGPLELGFLDAREQRPLRLRLRDRAAADAAMADLPEPIRRLDTAVLERLVLRDALGMTEDSIAHLEGLAYSRTDEEALELVLGGRADAAFFLRSAPVGQVREVAATGVPMPPKSTFFFPKVPTGLVFCALS
jgi:uncharacterized protein (DUF1015 family)